MIKITEAEMAIFNSDAEHQFIDKMTLHVNEQFTDVCNKITPDEIQQRIENAISLARSYDIVSEALICKFINIIFIFGESFNEQCDWALTILTDQTLNNEFILMDKLYSKAIEYEKQI